MPAFNITDPVSVGLSTKADHYHRVFDNTLALHGGETGIVGAAAGDDPYFSTATQLSPGARQLRETFRGLVLRTHPDPDKAASCVYLEKCDEIVFHDGTRVAGVANLVADDTVTGAGGRDSGAATNSAWEEVHVIRKSSDGTLSLLFHRAKYYSADVTQAAGNTNTSLRRTSAPTRTKYAQGFQPTGTKPLSFIDVYVRKNGSPTGNAWWTVEADTAGAPTGTPLATGDKVDVSLFPTSNGYFRFPFRNPTTPVVATQYHLVVQGDSATSDDVNNFQIQSYSAGAYASGKLQEYDSGVWADLGGSANYDLTFTAYFANESAISMPSGYDQRCHVGWAYRNSAGDFLAFIAHDKSVKYDNAQTIISSGGPAVPTLTDLSAMVPPVPVMITSFEAANSSGAGSITRLGQLRASGYAYGFYWESDGVYHFQDVGCEVPVDFQHAYQSSSGTAFLYLRSFRW